MTEADQERVAVYTAMLAAPDDGFDRRRRSRVTVPGDPAVDLVKETYSRAFYAWTMARIDDGRLCRATNAPAKIARTVRRRIVIADRLAEL